MGVVDEVLMCPFAMTPLEVEAHWAGKPSMVRHGLIPAEVS